MEHLPRQPILFSSTFDIGNVMVYSCDFKIAAIKAYNYMASLRQVSLELIRDAVVYKVVFSMNV